MGQSGGRRWGGGGREGGGRHKTVLILKLAAGPMLGITLNSPLRIFLDNSHLSLINSYQNRK